MLANSCVHHPKTTFGRSASSEKNIPWACESVIEADNGAFLVKSDCGYAEIASTLLRGPSNVSGALSPKSPNGQSMVSSMHNAQIGLLEDSCSRRVARGPDQNRKAMAASCLPKQVQPDSPSTLKSHKTRNAATTPVVCRTFFTPNLF